MTEIPQNIQDLTPEQQAELQEKLKNMSPEELMELQKKQCIFCQIIDGKIPSKKVYEDDDVVAVLDINPAIKGHVLLLTKEHYAIMPQIPDEAIGKIFSKAKKISQLLLKALRVDGTSIFIANGLVAGQRAQHFMMHVIPRKEGDKLMEVEEKLVEESEREESRVAIENKLNQLMGVKKKVVKTEKPKKEEVDQSEEKPKKKAVKKKAKEKLAEEPEPELEEQEQPEEEEEKQPPKKEEDVSLDDIANLFK